MGKLETSVFRRNIATMVWSGIALAGLPFTCLAADLERPDLDGTWTNQSITRLTRPDDTPLVVSAEQAQRRAAAALVHGRPPGWIDELDPDTGAPRAGSRDFGLFSYNQFWFDQGASLARVKGEYRISFIIDPENGQVPWLENPDPALQRVNFDRRFLTGVGDASGPEAMPLKERCLLGFGNTAGPGMLSTPYNSNYQFVQTRDHVVLLIEMVHDARIIPTYNSAEEARAHHRPDSLKPWFGDSRGWYENGTLIVETININPKQMRESPVPITATGKITERFSRYSENEIVYQFTVDDPKVYSQPWTAELSFYPSEGPVYEYACHEGNYAMTGILAGARREEAEAAAK
ncbi:MAG: hypothetical protein OXU30_15185 [Gammaproteobacteria bacterium]|nr:hypothetical protein [Gammaproteobacteria bacterium]